MDDCKTEVSHGKSIEKILLHNFSEKKKQNSDRQKQKIGQCTTQRFDAVTNIMISMNQNSSKLLKSYVTDCQYSMREGVKLGI